MRLIVSFFMLLVFGVTVIAADQYAVDSGHGHDCSVSAAHDDVGGSDAPQSSSDHHHCLAHCFHFSFIAVEFFGFSGWYDRRTFSHPKLAIYESPSLENLTPPPLKA